MVTQVPLGKGRRLAVTQEQDGHDGRLTRAVAEGGREAEESERNLGGE